jgi:hypothetical protein
MRSLLRKRTPVRLAALVVAVAALIAAHSAPAASAEASVAPGAYIPDAAQRPALIDRYSRLAGRPPVILSYYHQWDSIPFVPSELQAAWDRGAVPMITWEPMSYEGKSYPMRLIQRGRFDQYIRESARAAARWGKPILLRFAHEMNGTWYPWSRGADGNNSYRLKAVWRRVVGIFRTQGATNVQWVWTPNVNTGGDFPFRDLYPGDRWVDWVGFDGFNWAQRGAWNSFTEIVDNTYEELTKISSRPMIVAETGSNESGGDKAAWVASALRREIPKFGRIRGVVFFDDVVNENAEGGALDARVDSSPASLRAFRSALASPVYSMTRRQLLATPSTVSRDAIAPARPSGGFGQPSFFYRITAKLHGRYLWYAIGLAAVALLALLGGIAFARSRFRARAAR